MLLLLLSAPTAAALVADVDSCDLATVSATLPGVGQTNTPRDARLVALISGGSCSHPDSYDMQLLRQDDASVVAEGSTDWADLEDGGLLVLDPEEDLEAETAYTFAITPSGGWGETTEVGFTPGYGHVEGLTGEPDLTIVDAIWGHDAETLSVEYTVTPADDPDHLSILALSSPDGEVAPWVVLAPVSGDVQARVTWSSPSLPEDVCLSVTQIDGLGAEVEGDGDCAEVTRSGGCDTTGGVGMSVGIVVLGMVLVRGRR
jgi:uncharacterized protein (TIGR03382 family)